MRALSPILQRVVYPALGKVGYFHLNATSSVRVITYHGVLPEEYRSVDPFLDNTLVSVSSFRWQLELLKKHYNVISPEQFLLWIRGQDQLPERAVLLTCDDGLLNNLTTMVPILQEKGLRCLFFVTGRSAGNIPDMLWYVELFLVLMKARGNHQAVDWQGTLIPAISTDRGQRLARWLLLITALSRMNSHKRVDFLREVPRMWGVDPEWKRAYLDDELLRQRFQLLHGAELRQLADAGMTIGAHSMSHPSLSAQGDDLASAEITDCRALLQRCAGQSVWAIAYPFGDPASVGSREYQLAEKAGYECAFVNVGGGVDVSSSKFSLPRIHVTTEMTPPVYEAHISGFHSSLQSWFRRTKALPKAQA